MNEMKKGSDSQCDSSTQVSGELERLEKRLCAIMDLINIIEDRLSSVLPAYGRECESDDDKEPELVPLAGQLRRYVRAGKNIEEKMQDILNNIEL